MKRTLLAFAVITIFAVAAILAIAGRQKQHGTQADRQNAPAIAGQMIGKIVQNQQGQGLGRVVALMTREGHIVYILMSKLEGRDWIPVPIDAAHLNTQRNAVVLRDLDVLRMSEAPALSPDDLQMLDDPQFENRVHSYYGNAGHVTDPRESTRP